jgi:hypothetical protein
MQSLTCSVATVACGTSLAPQLLRLHFTLQKHGRAVASELCISVFTHHIMM